MLKFAPSDRRGWTAKVCDFGLARICHGEQISADLFGTISHISPELFSDGRVSKKGGRLKTGSRAFGLLAL